MANAWPCSSEDSEGAVQQAALELRREFGNVLRHEIGLTVTDASQVDGEIRYLVGPLRSG